jgi:hypothetical protein
MGKELAKLQGKAGNGYPGREELVKQGVFGVPVRQQQACRFRSPLPGGAFLR